jgi:hypothetical protein
VGAVVCLVGLASAVGCSSGPVALDAPALHGADARTCAALVEALPDRVADLSRVESDPGDGYGAAWGDPPVELRCGVPRPQGFDDFATCQTTNGVDWFIPESQQTGRPEDITMTTVGRSVNLEVRIPSDYFPPAAAMVDLARAVKRATRSVRPCL